MVRALVQGSSSSDKSTIDKLELWRETTDSWKKLTRKAETNLASIDIGIAEFRILKLLDESGRTVMARLSQDTLLSQAAITVIVDKLEEHDLVARIRSEVDRRSINIQITMKGRSLLKEARKIHKRYVDQILDALSDDELRELHSIMSKLARRSDSIPAREK